MKYESLLVYKIICFSIDFYSGIIGCDFLKKLAAIKRTSEVRNQWKKIYITLCFSIDYYFLCESIVFK